MASAEVGKERERLLWEGGPGQVRPAAWRLVLAGAVAVLVGLALLLGWGSLGGEAQGYQPDYYVSMEHWENILDPCHNITSDRNAVIIENPDPDYKEINVTINIGGGISVEPSQFTVAVGPGETVRTEINISVLPNTALQQKSATVRTKIVRWMGMPYPDPTTKSTGFQVLVLPCAAPELTSSTPSVEGRAGDNLTLRFSLVNKGNYNDDFTINVTGLPEGWRVESPDNFSLLNVSSQGMVNFTLYLRADSRATARFNIIVASVIQGPQGFNASLTITAEVGRSIAQLATLGGLILALPAAAAYLAVVRRKQSP